MVEFSFSTDLDEVISNSDAIIVVTAHQEYKDLNLVRIKAIMNKDPIIIDGRRTFDPVKVVKLGFSYRGVGRGQILS